MGGLLIKSLHRVYIAWSTSWARKCILVDCSPRALSFTHNFADWGRCFLNIFCEKSHGTRQEQGRNQRLRVLEGGSPLSVCSQCPPFWWRQCRRTLRGWEWCFILCSRDISVEESWCWWATSTKRGTFACIVYLDTPWYTYLYTKYIMYF